jgi:protease I
MNERTERVAVIVDEMFEDAEFRVPYDRLRKEGYEVVIIGHDAGARLTGKKGRESIITEKSIREVSPEDFDALVIPGGYSPDHLRLDPAMVRFTKEFVNAGKPVAAVCHAGWMLAEADVLDGRTVTSWPSIKTDLINAGATWVDREVVEDGNLITSRKPADLPAFTEAILRHLEGRPSTEAPLH